MCGIVGFITEETTVGATDRRKWFINALRADIVRGDDGTGVFMVHHEAAAKEKADWCKIGGTPDELLWSEVGVEKLGAQAPWERMRCAIGHNRSATVGNASTANAHPFQEGPITLVHNGTLTSMHGLPIPKSKTKGADVDSHVITHNLASHSVAEVVRELDGAYVLVWHDSRDQSVNIIRNTQRPLHLMPLKYHKTILMASEAEMLYWLVRRSAFTGGDIYYPEAGTHLKFLPEAGLKPVATKLDMYKWTYSGSSYGSGYGGGYGKRGFDDDDYSPWQGGDDDDVPFTPKSPATEGSNMGKAERPILEAPKIASSALNKKVPKGLSKTLQQEGLVHLDKLRMRVQAVTQVHGTNHAIVIGRLIDLDRPLTAHIYGLMYDAVKGACGREPETWTVAPNGVKMLGQTSVVLCRLLSRSAKVLSTTRTDPSSTSSPELSPVSSIKPGDELWDALTDAERVRWFESQVYRDSMGNVVPYRTWLVDVSQGCVYCRREIVPEDALDIQWDSASRGAICPECVEEFTQDDPVGNNNEDDLEDVTQCLGIG